MDGPKAEIVARSLVALYERPRGFPPPTIWFEQWGVDVRVEVWCFVAVVCGCAEPLAAQEKHDDHAIVFGLGAAGDAEYDRMIVVLLLCRNIQHPVRRSESQ